MKRNIWHELGVSLFSFLLILAFVRLIFLDYGIIHNNLSVSKESKDLVPNPGSFFEENINGRRLVEDNLEYSVPEDYKYEKLLSCSNHTQCIKPVVHLEEQYKIYFCRHIAYGVRFFYLAREGLLLHPKVLLVDKPENADFIIYLPVSSDREKSECSKSEYASKLIVLDEGDGPELFLNDKASNRWFFLYFKRSYVDRKDGKFKRYMNYVKRNYILPMTYPIAEAYIRPKFIPYDDREFDIVCTLRGSAGDPVSQSFIYFICI